MRFRDASWWWIFIPLLVGHLAVIAFCGYAGWVWGRALFAPAGETAPGWGPRSACSSGGRWAPPSTGLAIA